MAHREDCNCKACEFLDNGKPFRSVASVLQAIHRKLLKDKDQNPAKICCDQIEADWKAEGGETPEDLQRIVGKHLRFMQADNPNYRFMSLTGARQANAQMSSVNGASPHDFGNRQFENPLFYWTVYCGPHRVTVSVA